MTDDQYYQFFTSNPDLRIERTAHGNILIIPPAGFESGHRKHELNRLLDPDHRTAYIYRPGCEPEQVVHTECLVGEGPVTSFVLELADIWAGL